MAISLIKGLLHRLQAWRSCACSTGGHAAEDALEPPTFM